MTTSDKPDIKKGFMCRIDYEIHLEDDHRGRMVFPTVEDLEKGRPCVRECGIVEVEVRLVRIVHKGEML